MRLMIIGAGGIGGYLAGRLVKAGETVALVARGAHLEAIREKGLRIEDNGADFTVRPACSTDKPAEAGLQDAIFFCTKSYGLADAVLAARPCIGPDTLLIPLLNGVSAARMIREQEPGGQVMDGCIYIFSQIASPGVISRMGDLLRVVVGAPEGDAPERLHAVARALEHAGVPAEVSSDIRREMWMKWLLMVSNAQAAAYHNLPIGPMREDAEKFALVYALLDEALSVAAAEQINLPPDIRERVLKTVFSLAYGSTPSLARDLNTPGKETEADLFAGELCRLADKHGVDVPCNKMVLEHFRDRL